MGGKGQIMDLWNYKKEAIKEAVRDICEERGFRALEVFPLTTGLWVRASTTKGIISFNDFEVTRKIHETKTLRETTIL